MKTLTFALAVATIAAAVTATTILLFMPEAAASTAKCIPDVEVQAAPADPLTHAQRVWTYALEWCESRGNPEAINQVDRDGTSSYGAWQFKPATLWHYGTLYGVPGMPKLQAIDKAFVMNRDTQSAVLDQMVLHRDEIKWSQQFPDCTKKLGYPPRKN